MAQVPNAQTQQALAEFHLMKQHPEQYQTYSSFAELLSEITADMLSHKAIVFSDCP